MLKIAIACLTVFILSQVTEAQESCPIACEILRNVVKTTCEKACTVDFSRTSGSFFTATEPVTDKAEILKSEVPHGAEIALFCGYDRVVPNGSSGSPWLGEPKQSTAATCQNGVFVWEYDGGQAPPVCRAGATTGEVDHYTNCPDYKAHCEQDFVHKSCKATCA